MRSKWVKKSWSPVPLLAPCLHRRHRPLLFPGGRPQRTDAMVPLACAISSRRASRQSSSWSPLVDPAISNWAPLSVHRCRIRPSDCRIYHITQPLSTPPFTPLCRSPVVITKAALVSARSRSVWPLPAPVAIGSGPCAAGSAYPVLGWCSTTASRACWRFRGRRLCRQPQCSTVLPGHVVMPSRRGMPPRPVGWHVSPSALGHDLSNLATVWPGPGRRL
jgi:hypothetical protein